MNIRIRNTQRKRKPAAAKIKRQLATLLRSSGLPDAELSLLFTGEQAMRTLNRKYRGKDRSTDVLSFSYREGPFAGVRPDILGDIVIAIPVAAKQATAAGHTFEREIERLLVHGLVHLLGYDHERGPREAIRMQRKEAALLKRLAG